MEPESGSSCLLYKYPWLTVAFRFCFPRKFSLDDLLTNIMLYWTTGTITSSQRFYKENMGQNFLAIQHER